MDAESLTLRDRCRLLGGASTWRTHAVTGIPAMKMTDGPNGARGDGIGTQATPGVVVPVGIAMGATWDPEIVGELATLLGREARRKAAHVLLAPTVNLQRTPIGGRVFECFSEDPELTARLAVAYVQAVQAEGVAVTVKHFVANDTEVDRFTVDVHADERTLRELYLRPFEAAVIEGGAWGVMAAYNQLHGEFCAGNRWLLTDVLRDEWGFDGFVVSDWFGAHDTVASARAGLTIAMPGPSTIYGDPLLDAVEDGRVEATTVDDRVGEVARLAERTGATQRSAEAAEQAVDDPAERALCRRAVAASAVLLRNEDAALPLQAGERVAVIGPNAAQTRIMGGGSASLEPLPYRSILEALQARDGLHVDHEVGVTIDRMAPPVEQADLRTPDGGDGLLVEYRNGADPDGPVVATGIATSTSLRWFGSTPEGVDPNAFNVTVTGTVRPRRTGPHRISAVTTGPSRVDFGGAVVLDDPDGTSPRGDFFFGLGSREHLVEVDLDDTAPVPVRFWLAGAGGFAGVRIGIDGPDDPDRLARAVRLAERADVAVVVVGTNDEWETEGTDRTTIDLPGDQDELVARVAAAARRTVVVVNAGSPVAMPWRDDVDAILLTWFGGHAMGDGVVDVLLGDADPGGRLPITYPKALEDTPAWPHYAPVDGVQSYGEGLAMGYRGFQRSGVAPLFPFGHGLSYGNATWVGAHLSSDTVDAGQPVAATVTVTASAGRAATVVVQAYVTPSLDDDPPLALAGWTRLVVQPGERREVDVTIPPQAFRRWDAQQGWVVDPGPREVVIAASCDDHRFRLPLVVRG